MVWPANEPETKWIGRLIQEQLVRRGGLDTSINAFMNTRKTSFRKGAVGQRALISLFEGMDNQVVFLVSRVGVGRLIE